MSSRARGCPRLMSVAMRAAMCAHAYPPICLPSIVHALPRERPTHTPRCISSSQYPAGLRWLRSPSACAVAGSSNTVAALSGVRQACRAWVTAPYSNHFLLLPPSRKPSTPPASQPGLACATSRNPPARLTAATRSGRPAAASWPEEGMTRSPMRDSRLSGGGCVKGASSCLRQGRGYRGRVASPQSKSTQAGQDTASQRAGLKHSSTHRRVVSSACCLPKSNRPGGGWMYTMPAFKWEWRSWGGLWGGWANGVRLGSGCSDWERRASHHTGILHYSRAAYLRPGQYWAQSEARRG